MFSLILYVHILSAVFSIGPYVVLLPFLYQQHVPERVQLLAYLQSFRFVVRLSKHAGHVLVLSGALLVWWGHWKWTTAWIVLTLLILFGSLFFIARAFTPLLRKLADAGPEAIGKLMSKLRLAIYTYLLLMLIMMSFMVAKPTFW